MNLLLFYDKSGKSSKKSVTNTFWGNSLRFHFYLENFIFRDYSFSRSVQPAYASSLPAAGAATPEGPAFLP